MEMTYVNPPELGPAKGFSHGVLVPAGRLLFVAGQIARTESGKLSGSDFVTQFDRALGNVIRVVKAAGGGPKNIVRLTIYVTNKTEYVAARKEIGVKYQERMGKHYPAMAMLEVKGLFDEGAKLELEATAVI